MRLPLKNYIGALVIGTGFWGTLYYIYNKDPPQQNRITLNDPFNGILYSSYPENPIPLN